MPSCWACIGRVWLCTTLWTLAQQAPQCIGFSRQGYVLDCHFLLQANFQTQGATMTPASPALQADSLLLNQVAARWTIREVQLGNHKMCIIKTYYRKGLELSEALLGSQAQTPFCLLLLPGKTPAIVTFPEFQRAVYRVADQGRSSQDITWGKIKGVG